MNVAVIGYKRLSLLTVLSSTTVCMTPEPQVTTDLSAMNQR